MGPFSEYRVDTFLLGINWTETDDLGVAIPGRISYVVRGGETKAGHLEHVEEFKNKILRDNDEDYTSFVFTYQCYGDIGGIDPHVSVIQFRVRDSY